MGGRTDTEADIVIIGGGFFGCCLALFLRSVADKVTLVERAPKLMDRASRINQARIHTGFHYPRSFVTALRSLALHRRFAADFPQAVVDNFQMIYAIARRRSLVSSRRFHNMFRGVDAPIAPIDARARGLFNWDLVEGAFHCDEFAFDHGALRDGLQARMVALGIDVRLSCGVAALRPAPDHVDLELEGGGSLRARQVFNVTYSGINDLLRGAGIAPAPLKHELTELALIEPPESLRGYGITVMDGPFFSTMPYPAEALYSLTHVRYTPHAFWRDDGGPAACPGSAASTPHSRWRHMVADARRYVPAMEEAEWRGSRFEVKSLLTKNELDDGRPILLHRQPDSARVTSVLGGKLDNVYDLFERLRQDAPWRDASDVHVRTAAR